MHPNRRRKKRPNYGIRSVEVVRGPNGFGFTISGQQPCILSCIVKDSPADRAGLRPGDFLISVNDVSVSKTTHDAVVNLIGNCAISPIKMTIAENYYSDSSDEEANSCVRKPKHKQRPLRTHRKVNNNVSLHCSKYSCSKESLKLNLNLETPNNTEYKALVGYLGALETPKQFTSDGRLKGLSLEDQGGPIEYKSLVGYLGTIEMPKQLSPETRLQTVCNCIRKLRQEKRNPTAVLMTILPTCLTLKNASNHILAIYPTNRVVYVGSTRDKDSRYFGLVTSAICDLSPKDGKKSNADVGISNSCHIFVTDPKLIEHNVHVHKAEAFNITCTLDPISGRCLEFPKDSLYIVSLIQSMYKLQCDKPSGIEGNVPLVANSPQPSASSNSDSGIGFRDDFNAISDRIVLVEFPARDLNPLQNQEYSTNPESSKPNELLKTVLNNEKKPLNNIQNLRMYESVSIKNTFGPKLDNTKNNNEIEARLNNFSNLSKPNSSIEKLERNVSPSSFTSSEDNTKNDATTPNCSFQERPIDVPHNFTDEFKQKSLDNLSMCSLKSANFDNVFKTPAPLTAASFFDKKTKQNGTKLASSCDNLDKFGENSKKRKMGMKEKPNYSYEELNNFDFGQQLGYGSLNELFFSSNGSDKNRAIARSEPDVRMQTGMVSRNLNNENDATSPSKMDAAGNAVQGWAASFERLLDDREGVKAFAEFLKMEFSSENIDFWMSVERFRRMPKGPEKKTEARRIYQQHVCVGAPEAVNVDAQARQYAQQALQEAPSNIFDLAQKQVLNLMKFDSYPRFLKSDLYKQCVSKLSTKTASSVATPNKLKKSLSNAEDRRRKSLLPWHRKSRSKSKEQSENGDESRNEIHSSRSSLTSLDLAIAAGNSQNDSESVSGTVLCRVTLGNSSTTVVQIKPKETVQELAQRLLEKRGLNYTSFEVFTDRHTKPVDVNEASVVLAGCEVKIQQRVVFKLDLPNRKTVSVKSKATKMIIDVLKPIVHKYDFQVDQVFLLNPKDGCVLDIRQPITVIDGLKLQVQLIDKKTTNIPELKYVNALKTNKLVEITNQVFEGILQEKSENPHPKPKSDKGSVKSEDLGSEHSSSYFGKFLRKDSTQQDWKKKSLIPRSIFLANAKVSTTPEPTQLKNKPLIAKWKAGVNKLQVSPCSESDCNELVEGLTRAQKSRLEDQRGTEINFELPDFLKDKENDRKTRKSQQFDELKLAPPSSNYENQSIVNAETSKNEDSSPVNTPNKQMKMNNTRILSSQKVRADLRGAEPPPLPPKPKIVPLKPPNWGQNDFVKTLGNSQNKQALFLEQPSSSFV